MHSYMETTLPKDCFLIVGCRQSLRSSLMPLGVLLGFFCCRMLIVDTAFLENETLDTAFEPMNWDKSNVTVVTYPNSHSRFGVI